MSDETPRHETSDLVYAASYAGFVGSGALALFFLIRDTVLGEPLMTPSIFGAAIFGAGVPAEPAVRLDQVAVASLVHVALFTVVGAPFAYLVHQVERLRDAPLILASGLFAVLGAGIVSLDLLLAPGLITAIGPLSVTLGNTMTAGAMTLFYRRAFSPEPVAARAR